MTGMTQGELNKKYRGEVKRQGYTLEYALESVGPGWADLVRAAYQACEDDDALIVQVKEKFGGLRIYFEKGSEHLWELTGALEVKSYKICEKCGERGKPRTGGWIQTLCEEHADGRPESNIAG